MYGRFSSSPSVYDATLDKGGWSDNWGRSLNGGERYQGGGDFFGSGWGGFGGGGGQAGGGGGNYYGAASGLCSTCGSGNANVAGGGYGGTHGGGGGYGGGGMYAGGGGRVCLAAMPSGWPACSRDIFVFDEGGGVTGGNTAANGGTSDGNGIFRIWILEK